MTETHTAHWHAVARRRDLRHRPLRIWFQGTPIVLFEGADGPAALTDRCPHRLVELSKGRVMQGEIECPYHGWRFDGSGRCTAIPGHLGACPTYQVKRHNLAEADGVIYLSEGTPDASPYTHCMADHPVICRRVRSVTRSSVIDVAENILDATHTHFTHKGLLRGLSAKRHTVQVEVTGGPDWVEACYTGEDRQDGVISRLMEGTRMKTIGRFKAPGIAELEYWGPNGRVLATTFHLRPGAPGHVDGIGFLVGPDEGFLSRLKALAFPLFFRIALEQDRRVLSSAAQNAALVPGVQPAIGPLDFLRADIAAILDGRRPVAADSPRMVQMTL